MTPRPKIEHQSGTAASFKLIKTWISRCTATHNSCGKSYDFVPTRLIDVNGLRLVTRFQQSTRYAALSHCWGLEKDRKVPMPKTTKKTLDSRVRGFEWTELTKTFQDAIIIARELDLEFIWIDSLCIIQDDDHDWAVESGQMSSIYGGAHIVISATRSAIGDDGILHTRPAQIEIEEVMVRPRLSHDIFVDPNASKFGDNPLFSRGWCFQERLLAQRVIHFAADELVWECNEDLRCECGGIEDLGSKNFKVRLGSILQQDDPSKRSSIWAEVIRAYTSRQLTYETDRMPALSGIAQRFQTQYSGRYLAGLWEADLPAALLWTETGPEPSKRQYVERCGKAPSWTWLSLTKCKIQPHFQYERASQIMALVRHVQCRTTTLDPYGKISGGQLVLEAPAVEVTLQKVEVKLIGLPTRIDTVLLKQQCSGRAYLHTDSCFPRDLDVPGTAFLCVAIRHAAVRVNPVRCLVLRQIERGDKYCRMGDTAAPEEWFEGLSPSTITII